MKIVGQTKLLEKLNNYTLITLPKTLLFLGEDGCGKHTMINYITEKIGLDLVELTDKITAEQLTEFTYKTTPTAYLINLTNFDEKKQNQFLKFIEEPGEYIFIMLIANSEMGILPTILNRCVKYKLEPYSKEELQEISGSAFDNEWVYKICKTPGQITALNLQTFTDMCQLCNTIITKIKTASYANTLTIATKINYKEDYNKFDFDLFFNALEFIAFETFKETNNEDSFKVYQITNQFKQARLNKAISKETFVLNFLTQLWEAFH